MSRLQDHVHHLVDDYVHDLLSAEESARLEEHCRVCPGCARELDRARRRMSLLQTLPPVEPSVRLVSDTLEHVQRRTQYSSSWRRRVSITALVGLAAALAILTGLQFYYTNLKASTIDLILLGQREWLAATTASLRVRVVDRQTNALLSGIPVLITLQRSDGKRQELARFTTDELGTGAPQIQLPDWPDGEYRLEITAQTPAGREALSRNVKLKRSWKLMLTSDKPVYQPGQKILLRALALRRPDLRPVGQRQATFSLLDPRGNVLFKHTQPTSRFGIASSECELAQEVEEGTYTVRCAVEGVESQLNVEVKRYVLPKFKLTVRPGRTYYLPGDVASLTIQADYFFGKPVQEGRLEYIVRSRTGLKIAQGEAKTNDQGACKVDLTIPVGLPGREDDQGDARLVASVMLTDSAGQKQLASTELLVTSEPVRVRTMPESGTIVREVPNKIYLLVSQPDGTPLSGARVQIKGDQVGTEVKTDSRGVASFEVTPRGNDVAWNLRVSSDSGEVLARRNERYTIGNLPHDFLIRLDRAVYQAGQTMTLTAFGGGTEPVFVDLIKDGQTMLSQTVEIREGKGELIVDLPADLFGTLELIAYRFSLPAGLPLRKSRVLYITPPQGLRIQATLDQGEYRPGREAQLQLRLVDASGKPTPGAISLSAVDEAVFSVLTPRPGMEQAFYTLEEEMLKPVYTLYPWEPSTEEEVLQRDRALFASTARGLENPEERGYTRRSGQIPEVGAHTLAMRSLPIKQQQTEQLKYERLLLVKRGWILLVLATILCAYAALWLFVPLELMLKMHAVGFAGILFIGLAGYLFVALVPQAAMRFAASDRAESMTKGAAMPPPRALAPDHPPGFDEGEFSGPRVRKHFPETLLWEPQLITDDQGRLPPLQVKLADSITSWQISVSAVSAEGQLGATQFPLKVFQPFFVDLNLPVTLTRGDEVGVPVVVYNYLDRPQTVTLTLTEGSWFTLKGKATQQLELAAGEVRSTRFTIQVKQVGRHPFQVQALAGKVGDALERTIEVIPDGKRVEFTHSGTLTEPVDHLLVVPPQAIEGSAQALVKLYPSKFSTLVEGLDNIFQMPFGCFEQTSSTTYPNVLALDYLRKNKLNLPKVEAKARQYIHLGYQRLVGFEVQGGGFDWYGRPPADVALTAYGLMEFVDMARVHEVDPRLLQRTRNYLLRQRRADGSWDPSPRGARFAGGRDQQTARLATTAYVAWAVFSQGENRNEVMPTLDWLLAHRPTDIKDPHTLALVCHALLALDGQHQELSAYLDRLVQLSSKTEDGRQIRWQPSAEQRTLFFGSGLAGQIETTALATLALIEAKVQPELIRGGLAFLVAHKDAQGTWHSTQATVMALKALLAGTVARPEGEQERRIELLIGQHRETLTIPVDQAEVLKSLEISKHLQMGNNLLTLKDVSKSGASYQVVLRYHVPEEKSPSKREPLALTLDYDRTELLVGGSVHVQATVENRQAISAPMVMLELPIPPGFTPRVEDFTQMVQKNTIDRFQVLPRSVLVYLRGLDSGAKLTLPYQLQATMPVQVAAPGGRVYEYYDPQKQGRSAATRFVVRSKD